MDGNTAKEVATVSARPNGFFSSEVKQYAGLHQFECESATR